VKKNLNTVGRVIRIAAVVAIGALIYFEVLDGAFGIGLSVVAMLLTVTTIRGYCPIIALVQKKENKKDSENWL